MGKLIEGVWHDRWYDTASTGGRFVRGTTTFREPVCEPVAGRYHLYVSLACPWAHRVLIMRALKGLDDAISVSGVEPLMLENGWEFSERYPDPVGARQFLHEVYTAAQPDYSGRVTVPVLWDTQRHTIANNESSELIRILNTQFASLASSDYDYYPPDLRDEIDAVNARVYDHVNNGVYRAGFATTQGAYDEAVIGMFETLDELEARLAGREWLVGDRITEADIRLFPTLLRFDPVYYVHFKCCRRRLVDYPNLLAHTRRMYALPGVAETFDLDYTRLHYFASHRSINPHGILPIAPDVRFT
jgi:putative glutathione S-transferase